MCSPGLVPVSSPQHLQISILQSGNSICHPTYVRLSMRICHHQLLQPDASEEIERKVSYTRTKRINNVVVAVTSGRGRLDGKKNRGKVRAIANFQMGK